MAPPAIQDEFTDLPISRTRRKQLRNERDGLCQCGKDIHPESVASCLQCIRRQRKYARKRAKGVVKRKYRSKKRLIGA